VGLGRTGTFAAVERYGIEPDMVTYGKALCGGLFPLSALVLSAEYYERLPDWPKTALGSTFSCSPFACALGVHVVERVAELLRSGVLARRGKQFDMGLRGLTEYRPVRSVRTYGLALAVDLDSSKSAARFVSIALEHGLLLYVCGPRKDVVKIYPPYNVSDECAQLIFERLRTVAAVLEREALCGGAGPQW
jgi:acetylornithine/succinyldiaminopimelate/putrescine aminotransferase